MTTSADSAPALVLILGGTSESRRLAALLTRGAAGPLRVVSSLAGRVARPVLPEVPASKPPTSCRKPPRRVALTPRLSP
ncbi:precorrin-6A/cobalt-precorrin-6A reductase, partial [Streptomyces albidoflavus]|uniref:precorrin-6A/cobalt-precorrin-6A reductase n=1 Tax=Streptomyces albidoflavus TaxID=1886 RepID=UPI0033B14822